jgi:hypothetical protein
VRLSYKLAQFIYIIYTYKFEVGMRLSYKLKCLHNVRYTKFLVLANLKKKHMLIIVDRFANAMIYKCLNAVCLVFIFFRVLFSLSLL